VYNTTTKAFSATQKRPGNDTELSNCDDTVYQALEVSPIAGKAWTDLMVERTFECLPFLIKTSVDVDHHGLSVICGGSDADRAARVAQLGGGNDRTSAANRPRRSIYNHTSNASCLFTGKDVSAQDINHIKEDCGEAISYVTRLVFKTSGRCSPYHAA
jgi:hypothetical protein